MKTVGTGFHSDLLGNLRASSSGSLVRQLDSRVGRRSVARVELPRRLQVAKLQRTDHVGHLLTQGRQGLSAALGHGRLRTEADSQSGGLRRVEHPLISPLSIARRRSQCPTFADAKLTCGSRSSFSVADRRHRFTYRDYRYRYWNRSPITGRHQSRSTVGLDRLQRHHFRATPHQPLGRTAGSSLPSPQCIL